MEDNAKLDRLKKVNAVTKLPFDEPVRFPAKDITTDNPAFAKFLDSDGDRLCALRLMPIDPELPKLRMRGLNVRGAFDWFNNQDIDRSKYQGDFRSHADHCDWSSIFIINRHGISGEIIRGRLHNLSQGFYDEEKPIVFHYNFKKWQISPSDDEALTEIKRIVQFLYVEDVAKQKRLTKDVDAKFYNNYMVGYFETVEAKDVFGLHFDDYSQSLGDLYKDFVISLDNNVTGDLSGRGASAGVARGPVKIVKSPDDPFDVGAVLVAEVTTPDLVELMSRASAIVTNQGGILSHAAIIARELAKPCVVDVGDATERLCDGQLIEVDGSSGVIKLL